MRKDYYGGNIHWLKTGDLTDGYIYEIPETITDKALEETSVKLNPTGSVLIAMYGATIGKIGILTFPATTNQACCACVDYKAVTQKYLFYFLLSYKEEFVKMGGGGAQPNISKEKIISTLIPVPPIAEQNRIADEIERLIAFIETIDLNQDRLEQSIKLCKERILDMAVSGKLIPQDQDDEPAIELLRKINPSFAPTDNRHYENKPFSIPDSWVWVIGKDLFLPMKNCKPSGEYFKYIDIDSIDNQDCVIKCPKVLPVTAAPSRATRYTQVGDILFSMVRPYLKNIAIVTEGNCIASTGFYVCSPNEALFSKYCYYLMISPYVINGLTQFMKGDNSPSINNAHISEWLYPLPPLNEQKRIVQKIDEIFNYLDSIVAEL
jgi:type I restriction enzyme S subunit